MKISNNLYFVCLNEEFGKEVCEKLAKILVLPFIECEAFVAKDLLTREVDRHDANIEYLKRQEECALCNCLMQNGIFLLSFDLLKHNIALFKDEKLFYLKVPQEKVLKKINKLAFASRDKFLTKYGQVIEVKSTRVQAIQKIITILGDI